MTERESLCFPREERLKLRKDIQAVFKKGASASCSGARLFFLRKEGEGRRIAFTFARKFGNAVERNRARRLGREAYRHLRSKIKGGYDLALLVYPGKNNFSEDEKKGMDFSARLRQMKALLGKAGLFAAENVS
ncbi:MAG: ribonuclease P protein component [Spirochaetaceae bacterium]|jgi:ribonuclease P protein component|nr:ribonuclease P protein component [Spirochaetaceae bacterium]